MPPNTGQDSFWERWTTNLSQFLVAASLVAAGFAVLWFWGTEVEWGNFWGTTLIGVGLIAAAWQAVVDRWQTRLTKKVVLQAMEESDPGKENTKDAMRSVLLDTAPALGLQRTRLGTNLDIEAALKGCTSLAITCLYDKRWSDDWKNQVTRFGGDVRVCVPDPDDPVLMGELAHRHGRKSVQSFRNDVLALLTFFHALGRPNKIKLRTCPAPGPAYTCYLFGNAEGTGKGLTRMYKHHMHEKAGPLTEQDFSQFGVLYGSYLSDFNALWADSKPWPKPPSEYLHIAVIGPGDADSTSTAYVDAKEVGKMLAEASAKLVSDAIKRPNSTETYKGVMLVNGGKYGVMEAAADGAREVDPNMLRRAYLPDLDPTEANEHMTPKETVATGKGERRDLNLIENCDAVVAVGCSPGTLVETAWSQVVGRSVFGVGSYEILAAGQPVVIVPTATPKSAVDSAIEAARRARVARERR